MSEMPSCYSLEVRKARKDHACCECRGVIRKGEIYNHHSGIWRGEPDAYKVCPECDNLRIKCDEHVVGWEERTPFTNIYESVDCSGDVELMREFIEIKRKRGGRIEKWMEERIAEQQTQEQV